MQLKFVVIVLVRILVLLRSYKMYQLLKDPKTGQINTVQKQEGNHVLCIPFVEDNTDYQQYLAWLAEGNEPLPAE